MVVMKLPEGGHTIDHHLPQWRRTVIVMSKGKHKEYTSNIITSLISASVFFILERPRSCVQEFAKSLRDKASW